MPQINSPPQSPLPNHPDFPIKIQLRILETTDIHGNLLPYDYYCDKDDQPWGLARIATLVKEARNEVGNCLLFDNGDFLQGTPISDLTPQPGHGWTGIHPVITAMNMMHYDAVTPGNHEFNFGLDWLHDTLHHAEFPATCANVLIKPGVHPGKDKTLFPPYLLLHRRMLASDGSEHKLRIGVLGLVPPQITIWDQFHLRGRLQSQDIVEAAQAHIPLMRKAGADLIIVLAHTGIGPDDRQSMQENAALVLASVPGIDAILTGHTHQVFPRPACENDPPGFDANAGTLKGIPSVMAGFGGSHLGVIDLNLTLSAPTGAHPCQWQVASHHSEIRPVVPNDQSLPLVPPDPEISMALQPAHKATLSLTSQPLGVLPQAYHSYLALVRDDPATHLIASAMRAELRHQLTGSQWQDFPLLSATAPFKTGGRSGPLYYTDIPAGPVCLRNAADLYPFPNLLCGVLITGAQIHDWLERAASIFNQIIPGKSDQTLHNPDAPGHMFDVICQLTYQIDLSEPAAYDIHGQPTGTGKRIRALSYRGGPVKEGDRFVIATNNYRAFGGGPYDPTPSDQLIYTGHKQIRDILTHHIGQPDPDAMNRHQSWSLQAHPKTSVTFDTGPGLRQHTKDITALSLDDLGDTTQGFARFRLNLDPDIML